LGDGISAVSHLLDFVEYGADLKQKAGFLTQKALKTAQKQAKLGPF
jgi:hypothetical protein